MSRAHPFHRFDTRAGAGARALALALSLAACGGSGTQGSDLDAPGAIPCVSPNGSSFDPAGAGYLFERGLVYDSPGDGGEPLKGDLFRPARGGPFPTVLHIHGGGWMLGGRGLPMGTYFGEYLACRGFAFYDIDYRMIPRVQFPDDVRDGKCAIRWLRGNARRYGLDPDRMAVMGGSAGGHLTAMVALTAGDPAFDRTCSEFPDEPVGLQAAIPFYGVHDWHDFWALDLLDLESLYLGGEEGFPPSATALTRVEPVTYAPVASCPFHLIQGTADIGVLKEQATALDGALEAAGKESEITFIEGANHAFDLFPSSTFTAEATRALIDFLEARFGAQRPWREEAAQAPRATGGDIERHLALAKQYLEANMPRAAGVEYLAVVSKEGGLDPESCEGNYGYLATLATGYLDWLGLIVGSVGDVSRSTLPTILGTSGAPPLPAGIPPLASPLAPGTGRPADMDTVTANYIDPFEVEFTKPMEEALQIVLAKGCTFETNGVPVTFEGSVDPFGTMVFGKKFAGTEANVMGAFVSLTQALLDLIAAHDLSLDMGEASQIVPERILDDPVGFLRMIAIGFDHSPSFLAFHPTRKARFGKVAAELATATDRLGAAVKLLFRDEKAASREEAAERVLGYFDASGNGRVGPGDDLWLGLLAWDEGPGEAAYPVNLGQGGLGPVVEAGIWLIVDENYVNEWQALMAKISKSLRGSGELVNLADLNKIFSQLLTPLPEAIAIDLGTLLPEDVSKAKSLRELMPIWGTYDPPGGDETYAGSAHPTSLVEGELGRPAAEADEKREVPSEGSPCYVCLPGERFRAETYGEGAGRFRISNEVAARLEASGRSSAITPIPDDCAELPKVGLNLGSTPVPLTYFYLQDPTLNGSLFVNLETLRKAGSSCDGRDAEHSSDSWNARRETYPKEEKLEATDYSLNKALGAIVAALAPFLELLP